MLKLSSIFIFLTLLCFQISAQWQANGTAIYNTNSGNVGIGTTTPSAKLSVVGSIYKLTLSGIDGTYDNLIKYGHKSDLESGTSYANRWHGIDATITAGAALDNKLKFRLYSGGYGNLEPIDVLTLLGNGNVGVGITSPIERLHVIGNSIITGTIKAGVNSGTITQTASYPYSTIIETGADAGQIFFNAGSTNGYVSKISISGRTNGGGIQFHTRSNEIMRISDDGKVLIGKLASNSGTDYKLDIAGKIRADEIVVNTDGADFVFEPTYKLRSLSELETFIRTNKHLPDIAPAKEMQENGVSAGEMQAKLLQKVEELTLYVIEKDKEIADLKTEKDKQIADLKMMLTEMKKEIETLKSR